MGRVNGLRYEALQGLSRDLVEDVERVAGALVERKLCKVQLVGPITHPLRGAMVDLTPAGMYVEAHVDWGMSPPEWTFWFAEIREERRKTFPPVGDRR